jgi:hypothetical protein
MKNVRLPKFLDYIPPVIAFVAAVVAIVGTSKWNENATGIYKVTPLGWMVLGIGLLALLATLLITVRNSREQTQQRHTRERIAAIGKKQLLGAILHTVHPLVGSSLWGRKCKPPETPEDFLNSERREILSSLELTAKSPYMDGSCEDILWHQIFQSAATEGSHQIITTLQIYSTYFPAEIIEVATQYLNCEFLQMRLKHLTDVVDVNTHFAPNRPVLFFMVKEDEVHNQGYGEFWALLAQAMTLCGGKSSQGRPLFD